MRFSLLYLFLDNDYNILYYLPYVECYIKELIM